MEEMKHCQSCGMPLTKEEEIGTNKDNSKNTDYCVYCFKDGEFTDNSTMDEMIEISLKHMKEAGILEQQGMTESEAREFMYKFFPELKRWK
ncbi:MAG: zinc ribbon domain-containing protein [Oscillospiraceae bacterium]|nr:zinc ribbon domain-containing protein [Oscillospiraceae bacterium]